MKKMILAAMLALPCSAGAPWTTRDTIIEGAFIGALAVDWAQTRDIRNHPISNETNGFLGTNPSNAQINRYFITCAILHVGISYALPIEVRFLWQSVTIAMEIGVTSNNAHLGLRCRW